MAHSQTSLQHTVFSQKMPTHSNHILPLRSDIRLAEAITVNILNELGDIGSVLDIGCGDGVVSKHLTKEHLYFGIDLSESKIYEQNQSDSRINYCLPQDIHKATHETPDCDAVLLLDVLEHTPPFTELFECALLKSNKYVLVSLPNELFVLDRARMLLGMELPAHSLDLVGQPGGFKHQYIVNMNKARRILATAAMSHGFELKQEWFRPLVSKNKLLQPLLWGLRHFSSSQLWSMGSVFVFGKGSASR
jgi:2-polyprenyl-3-methyl-5-hydroxy-6-metoxy-1,4-benzoquinol methylase